MATKKCRGCKADFEPRNGHQLYCETCRPFKGGKPAGQAKGGRRAVKRLAAAIEQSLAATIDARIELAVEKRLAQRDKLVAEIAGEAVDARLEALASELAGQ